MEDFIINNFLPSCTVVGFFIALALCCVIVDRIGAEISDLSSRIMKKIKEKKSCKGEKENNA